MPFEFNGDYTSTTTTTTATVNLAENKPKQVPSEISDIDAITQRMNDYLKQQISEKRVAASESMSMAERVAAGKQAIAEEELRNNPEYQHNLAMELTDEVNIQALSIIPGVPYLAPVDLKPLPKTTPRALTPQYHFRGDWINTYGEESYDPKTINMNRITADPNDKYMLFTSAHFFPGDDSGSAYYDIPNIRIAKDRSVYADFAASATLVNPTDNPTKDRIIGGALSEVDKELVESASNGKLKTPPISPLYPFTHLDPKQARKLNTLAYNRFHIPVSDIEHRKAFRHIFITRPECYIMANGNGEQVLSEQCYYDDDFNSAYTRVPHILKLLSPRYVCPITSGDGINSNWNMLLTNRIMEMGNVTNEISSIDGAKSIRGYSISVPNTITSMQGKTLEITFRDTKEFEVYDCIRLWMLYEEKRHDGTFSPSFNYYQKTNGFMDVGSGITLSGNGFIALHPYDRAIEFPCTIFDIITDESDSRILHMTEYVGAYPVSLTNPFSNSANQALSENKVTASFKYQYMIENRNMIYVHFNYNAGIINSVGGLNDKIDLKRSLPFLLKDDYAGYGSDGPNPTYNVMPQYLGAAGMWTGTPYVVIADYSQDPIADSMRKSPYLCFMPLVNEELDAYGNLGITNTTGQMANSLLVAMDPYVDRSNEIAAKQYLTAEQINEAAAAYTPPDTTTQQTTTSHTDIVYGLEGSKAGFNQIMDAFGMFESTVGELAADYQAADAAFDNTGARDLGAAAGEGIKQIIS